MARFVVGMGKGSAISWGLGCEISSNSTSPPNFCSNKFFLDPRRVWRVRLRERKCGFSFESKAFSLGFHWKIPGGFLKNDVKDRDEIRPKLSAWRDGARAWKTVDDGAGTASSGDSLELRRFLRGYEGWQGEKPPRTSNKIIGRKKKKKYGENVLKMLKALEENPNIDEALEPWKGVLKESEQGMLLNDQWRCDRAVELFTWFYEQEGYRPNTCHYTIMLKKCGRAQKWDLVRNLLSEMQLKNVKLNSYTYNTLIDVYEKAGRKSEATFWFERSKKEGFLDEVAIGSQINVLKEFGDFEEGNKLYESLPRILAQKNIASGVQIQSSYSILIILQSFSVLIHSFKYVSQFNLSCWIIRVSGLDVHGCKF